MGSNTLVFESFKILFKVFVFDVWELKVFVVKIFLKYLIFSSTFKYFKYFSINILFSRLHVMPAKLITFTATSPNSANYWWKHLISVATTFVCSEDGLAPTLTVTIGQYPICSLVTLQAGTRLFWFPGWLWRWAVTLLHKTHKILAVISSVSSEGNIGILLWTSWLNLLTHRWNIVLQPTWCFLGLRGVEYNVRVDEDSRWAITLRSSYNHLNGQNLCKT